MFLIDTDPQGTLTTWHEKREAEVPRRVELPFQGIADGLQLLRERKVAFALSTLPQAGQMKSLLCSDSPISFLYQSVLVHQIYGRLRPLWSF